MHLQPLAHRLEAPADKLAIAHRPISKSMANIVGTKSSEVCYSRSMRHHEETFQRHLTCSQPKLGRILPRYSDDATSSSPCRGLFTEESKTWKIRSRNFEIKVLVQCLGKLASNTRPEVERDTLHSADHRITHPPRSVTGKFLINHLKASLKCLLEMILHSQRSILLVVETSTQTT